MPSPFEVAFIRTMDHEGYGALTNNRLDPGGQTFSGISRVYWPDWEGWKLIDGASQPFPAGVVVKLGSMVRSFYRVNFWNRIQGDKLAEISPEIACEVFDTAVNAGVHQAVKLLQQGHNVASGGRYELVVDGKLGPKTLETVKRYLTFQPGPPSINEEILLNCINGEQYIFYKSLPNHRSFRGWFRRV